MRRVLAAGLVASLFVVVGPPGKAAACSCAMSDPATQLEQSDAAFVGTLIERPTEPGDDFTGIWVFEVEEWVKGEMGARVGVHAGLDGGACGFEMNEGERAGVFLHNDNGRPSGGLCSVTTPEAMLAATRPLLLDGIGPPVFLVAADTGRARLATLDASGRLLNVAGDDRFGWAVSVCPGGGLLVETLEGDVTVRDLELEVVRTLDLPAQGRPEQVWCLDEAAERILAQTWDEAGTNSTLMVLGEPDPIFAGETYMMDVSSTHLALVLGPVNAKVAVIDLTTGERTWTAPIPDPASLAFSPTGEKLLLTAATFHDSGGYETVATVFDVGSGDVSWISPTLADSSVYDWVDEDRLWGDVYPVEAETAFGLIVDTRDGTTTQIQSAGWGYQRVGESLLAVSEGKLLLTSPDGRTETFANLPTPGHRLVAVLDQEATLSVPDTTSTTELDGETTAPTTNEAAGPPEASFPTGVAAAALGGVALILAVGWRAIRRLRV